jgi:LPS export ABC transporter protein LptC
VNTTNKYPFYRILLQSVAVIILTATLCRCSNSIEEVERLNQPDTVPVMYARDVSISESESGRIKYTLTAPLLRRFDEGGKTVTRFPEGFKVVMFDSLNPEKIRTEITAEYGINNEGLRIMEASRNVVIINYLKDEKLNTEHLVWNQNLKRVSSNVMVTITTKDKILYGEGMESDETFYNWVIKKPRGEMYINEDE